MLNKLDGIAHSFVASSSVRDIYSHFGLNVKDYERKEKVGKRYITGVDTYDIPIHIKKKLGLPLSNHKSSSFQYRENITDIKNHLKL